MEEPSRETTEEDIEKRYRSFKNAPVGVWPTDDDRIRHAAEAYETLLALSRWQQWMITELIKGNKIE